MDFTFIITVVLTVLTLAVWIFSFLMGTFRDGTAKALWKFTWAGLSALAAFGIVMLLRGTISDVAKNLVPTIFEGDDVAFLTSEVLEMITAFASAMVAPVVFCIIYLPIRWIFLIPQVLLWNKVISPKLDKLIKNDAGELKFNGVCKALWKIGGGVFRTCATIVLTSAIFLALSCYTVMFADAARPFAETYSASLDKDVIMVKDAGYTFADHFAVRTASFTYGGLFRAMTGVKVDEFKTNLPELVETSSAAAYQVCAIVYPADGHKFTPDELAEAADETFAKLCETDFFPSLVAYGMNTLAEMDDFKEELLDSENDSIRDMAETIIELMKDATTESVRADLLSLSDLLREASSSGLLDYVLSDEEGKEFPIKNLMDEERLTRLLMVVYDNSFGRTLFTPIINMALDEGLKALGSEPITIDANIENMTRTEMEAEARRLAKIIANLGAVLDSMQGENVSIGSVNAGALGEAIDLIKDSKLLGGQFDQVIDAIGKSETVKEALGDTSDVIIGSLKDAPSVEDTLVITQSFTVIAEELSKATSGEGDATANKEAVAGALQGLVNSSSEEGNDFILGKVDELFPAGEGEEAGAVMEGVKEIATSILETVTEIEELTDEQAAVEADALLGLYDMVSGNTEVSDNQEAAEEIIDNIAASTVLMKTVENAVESGNDFGLTENLPEETIDKIADVIDGADITEEQKATLLAFFGK